MAYTPPVLPVANLAGPAGAGSWDRPREHPGVTSAAAAAAPIPSTLRRFSRRGRSIEDNLEVQRSVLVVAPVPAVLSPSAGSAELAATVGIVLLLRVP
ncbi:hypothetical protein GCM10009744_32320 [Kribbella alba]|uniref:Uncharacterized protein n=1 Tax=Kribbella alba TaxID=190197 RepID=A0ABN2FC70_9ACTN